MATYDIVSSNYAILNDQTGSILTGSTHTNNNTYYTLIAPMDATGTLTLNLTAISANPQDKLRIYNDVPSNYTASFVYTGSTVGQGQLIGYIDNNTVAPQTYTASSGRAYIAWAPGDANAAFTLEWTGSGLSTVDSSSGVAFNKYAATFPRTSTSGSYMTFAVGRFTASAGVLSSSSDIVIGFWAKQDRYVSANTEVNAIFSIGLNGTSSTQPGIVAYKAGGSQNLIWKLQDSANSTPWALTMSNAVDGGGNNTATQYIPQWHHYGFVLRRSGLNLSLRGYKDGQIFVSGGYSNITGGGNFNTTQNHVLGNYRLPGNTVSASNNWSGSLDNVFLLTLSSGSTANEYNTFFTNLYNSGNYKMVSDVTSSFSASFSPKIQFLWRLEETGSMLNTKDYGSFGNIHSASSQVTGAGDITLTSVVSGYSYTPYASLVYSASTPSNATVQFTTQSYQLYENTASYVFGIQAVTAAVAQSATASIKLGDSNTATIGTDYNLIFNGTTYSSSLQFPFDISWPANDTSTKYITASIIDNQTQNNSSSFSVTFNTASLVNVTTGSPNFFQLTILDYEEGYPSLSSGSYNTVESAGASTFRIGVDRISGSNGPLSVNYSTVDFTALSGTNYTKTTGTLSWTDGDTAMKFTSYIPILYDGVYPQNNPVFQILLSGLSTGSFNNYPSAVTASYVTIVDQEPGTFNWSVTSLSAYETASSATVNLNRVSGTYGSVTASIHYSSSQGTISPISGSAGTLEFADGETTKQLTITLTDDLIDEPDDQIYYTVSSFTTIAGTAFTGSQGTLILTLIDNETGSVSFTTGSDNVYENTSSYIFGVQRLYGGDQAETASITYTGIPSAVENTDYNIIYNGTTQSSPFNITWADQDSSTKYITASIYDNQTTNAYNPKVINFSIDSSSISSIGPSSSFLLSILDYEEGIPSFTSASYSIGESSSSITIYVDRLSGSQGDLTVEYTTVNGTALSGTNYTYSTNTLIWGNGNTDRRSINIPILYDGVYGSDKYFTVSLNNLSTGSFTNYLSAISSSTITILDQEPGTFNWSVTSLVAYETGTIATTNLNRVSGTFGTVTASLYFSSSQGTISPATGSAGTLEFADGETVKQLVITLTDDLVDEVDDQVYYTISTLTSQYGTAFTGSSGTLVLTLIDNETGSVTFSSSSASVYENTSSYYIGVERLYGGDQVETASITYTSSSVVENTNFNIIYNGATQISPFNITWEDQDKTTKYITASIYDNQITNGTGLINFSIDSSSISAIGPSSSFVLSILDYEEGVPSFTSASYSIGESSSSIIIYVDRVSGSQGFLSASYTTINGTAISGTNYIKTTGTLSWIDGNTDRNSITIPIQYDNVYTPSNLTFAVQLSDLSTGSFSNYSSALSSSTITILDQEPGSFSLNTSSYSVIEGQSFDVTVNRVSGTFDGVTVVVKSSNATAVSGTDYNLVNQSITFLNGVTSSTFTVSTIENSTNVSPPPLYFNLFIDSTTAVYGTANRISPYTATVDILDNETGSIKFSNSSYTGSIGSIITIPVERYIATGAPDFAATASIGVSSSSTAVAGIDYTNIFPYTVTWADQVSGSVNISLQTLSANIWAGNKTLVLTASDLTNIGAGSIMTASVLFDAGIYEKCPIQYENYDKNYVIYDYPNLSCQFRRRTEQVPFSLEKRGTGRLRKP